QGHVLLDQSPAGTGMSSRDTLRFSYRLSPARTAAMVLIVLAVSCGLAYIAHTNVQPVRLFRLFTLSPFEATVFLYGFSALGFAAAFIELWFAVPQHRVQQYVVLGERSQFSP